MDLSEISSQLNSLSNLLARKPEINTAYLYGSFAKGDALPGSDIDIGVQLDPAYESDYRFLGQLSTAIEDLQLDRKVEAFVINSMSPLFRFNVIYPNKVLYCKDEEKRIEFELKTRRDYEDYLPFFNYRAENAVLEAKRRLHGGASPRQRKS
jgi:hypothetical protein